MKFIGSFSQNKSSCPTKKQFGGMTKDTALIKAQEKISKFTRKHSFIYKELVQA